jgi:hydroxyacylglutathione hydrolase
LLFVSGDETLEAVIEESLLVGQENFAGWLTGGIGPWERAGMPLHESKSVTGHEARQLLAKRAAALDVREPSEFAAGHVDRAVNMPLGSISKTAGAVPVGEPVIAYCGHGERSTTAISLLEREGVEAVNLEGGFADWAVEPETASRG